MSTPFAYKKPCVVSDPSNPTTVIVVGVNEKNDTILEVTRVDISDVENPKAGPPNPNFYPDHWLSSEDRVCALYPRSVWRSSIPEFYMRQFGSRAYHVDILANGNVVTSILWDTELLTSKLYSLTGVYKDRQFVTTVTTTEHLSSGSPWVAFDFSNGLAVNYEAFNLGQSPWPDASLSVGTYGDPVGSLAYGYLTVFDAKGINGKAYRAAGTPEGNTTVQVLEAPFDVNMNGAVLSGEAISITMGSIGYVVDRAPDGSTLLYSISPSPQTMPVLVPVTVKSQVPRFMAGRTSTVLGSNKLLLFGGMQNGRPTSQFHIFDTSTSIWTGVDLVDPFVREFEKSKTNIAAIAGGVAGGIVVLAIAAFFIFRRFRKQSYKVVVPNATDGEVGAAPKHGEPAAVIMTDVLHHQYQPSQQSQLPQQYVLNKHSVYQPPITYAALKPESSNQQTMVFQPQDPSVAYQVQPVVYTPRQDTVGHYSPPTLSATQDLGSPSTTVTYVDRESMITPSSAHITPATVHAHTGSPQHIP